VALYVVRHAKAGRRTEWDGPDTLRPLSDKGWEQATALAQTLQTLSPSKLISSPATRCMQTLDPLAKAINQEVRVDERLQEGGDIAEMIELFEDVPDLSVMSSHGDMIPELIRLLERRGMEIGSKPDWRKASVWVIQRTKRGFESAIAWAPPLLATSELTN